MRLIFQSTDTRCSAEYPDLPDPGKFKTDAGYALRRAVLIMANFISNHKDKSLSASAIPSYAFPD